MSSLVDLIYSRYIRRYSTLLLVILLLILFSFVAYYGYKQFYAAKKDDAKYNNVANANTRGKPAEVIFFYADWCPHCKKAKPQWFQFKEEYNGTVINGWEVQCREVDCTDENNEKSNAMIAKFKIESYPTIIMLVGETKIDFDAKVTKDALGQMVASATK